MHSSVIAGMYVIVEYHALSTVTIVFSIGVVYATNEVNTFDIVFRNKHNSCDIYITYYPNQIK